MRNGGDDFDREQQPPNARVTWIPAPSRGGSSFIPDRDEINVELQPPTPPHHQTPLLDRQPLPASAPTQRRPAGPRRPGVLGLFRNRNRRNDLPPQSREPEPWVFHHPARDDPNFPPFDVLNMRSSALFDRDRNPVLAMRSRTPSIGSFYEEMHNLRREAYFDQEDQRRAAQGLPPIDRAAAVKNERQRGKQMRKRGFGRFQLQTRPGRSTPELRYEPPPWAFETPPSSTTHSPSPPPNRTGPLGRLLSLKRAGTGPARTPLEPDVHPNQDPYTRPDRDAGGRREFVLEPYMDAQVSVAGSSRSRVFEPTIPMPEPYTRPSTMAGELIPQTNYNTSPLPVVPPRRPPVRNFHRRPEQNQPQYPVIPQPISDPENPTLLSNLIPPPPEPVVHENMYALPHERWRVPIPNWNVFGGVRKFPKWGRRQQQNVAPTPLPPPQPSPSTSSHDEETEEREPIVVPDVVLQSLSSDETLTEQSPLPRSMEAGPSTMPPPAPAAAEFPLKPPKTVYTPTSVPSPPASRPRSPIVPTKRVSAITPRDRTSSPPSRTSSPGFDRSVSTSSPVPQPRFIPFHTHIDQLIDVIKAIIDLSWQADRITVDYVPPVRPRPRQEAQAREYLAPPPPEPTTWYTGSWHERKNKPKKKFKERIITMMLPLTATTPHTHPNMHLSETDSSTISQRASPTILDHLQAGRTAPVHTRKGTLRRVAIPSCFNQPVQLVQSPYPPSSIMSPTGRPYSSTVSGNMVGSDGRVIDYVPPSTFFVLPQTATYANPMPTPPAFLQPSVVYSPRAVRVRYQV